MASPAVTTPMAQRAQFQEDTVETKHRRQGRETLLGHEQAKVLLIAPVLGGLPGES